MINHIAHLNIKKNLWNLTQSIETKARKTIKKRGTSRNPESNIMDTERLDTSKETINNHNSGYRQ